MIKKITSNEIEQIIELEENHLKQSLGYNFLKQEITTNPYSYIIGYHLNEKIVGYLSARIFEDHAEMLNIVVNKEQQKQGIGTKLLETLIHQLEKRNINSLILEVRASNTQAQYLYYKLGFKRILNRPQYYDNEDAYVFLWEKE